MISFFQEMLVSDRGIDLSEQAERHFVLMVCVCLFSLSVCVLDSAWVCDNIAKFGHCLNTTS